MDGSGSNGYFRKMRAFELAIEEAMEVLDYYCSIIRTSKKQGFNNATTVFAAMAMNLIDF